MDDQETSEIIAGLATLVSDKNVDESCLQKYIECNPFLIRGAGAHISFNLIISQLPLGIDFRTDFAWVDRRSFGPRIHLLELESPTLRILNKSGDFSQGYNHAIQQLRDWSHWARQNASYLQNMLTSLGAFHDIRVECHLVAGRHADLATEPARRRYRSLQDELQSWMHVRTWDTFLARLTASQVPPGAKMVKCVKYCDQGFFEKQMLSIRSSQPR